MYQIIVSDYFATGEGRTVCILITHAFPTSMDYDGDVIKNTTEFRVAREFTKKFDEFWLNFAETVSADDLIKNYKVFLPDMVIKVLTAGETSIPGNFEFAQSYHINYS